MGLVSLCAAALDQFVFKFILGLTIFCAIGFFLSTILSMVESVVYRLYKGFNWTQTKKLLPLRIAIKVGGGALYLVTLIWHAFDDTMVWLSDSAKRILRHRERRGALIPMALNGWRTFGVWAIGSSIMDTNTNGPNYTELQVIHDEETREVDLQVEVNTREEKEKNAANFWHQAHNPEEVRLSMVITHAHLGVIR